MVRDIAYLATVARAMRAVRVVLAGDDERQRERAVPGGARANIGPGGERPMVREGRNHLRILTTTIDDKMALDVIASIADVRIRVLQHGHRWLRVESGLRQLGGYRVRTYRPTHSIVSVLTQ